jgi:hypothetical protein
MPSARLIAAYASVPGKQRQTRGCFNCQHWTTRANELGTVPHCEKLACYTGRYAGDQCKKYERIRK